MEEPEDILTAQLKKFSNSKSEFGTSHVEGAQKENENIFVPEKGIEEEQKEAEQITEQHREPAPADTSVQDAARQTMRMFILFKVLNIAFAGFNTWVFNFYYKTKIFKAKELALDDEDMEEVGEFFQGSKFLRFLDVIPDEVWGFAYLEWMFIERAGEIYAKHELENKKAV